MNKLRKSLCAAIVTMMFATAPQLSNAGEIDKFLTKLGQKTGIKPVEKLGKELGRVHDKAKKDIKIYGHASDELSGEFRKAGDALESKKEVIIAGVAFAALGAWVCVDGCTLTFSALTKAGSQTVAIPVASTKVGAAVAVTSSQATAAGALTGAAVGAHNESSKAAPSKEGEVGDEQAPSETAELEIIEEREGEQASSYPSNYPTEYAYYWIKDLANPSAPARVRYRSSEEQLGPGKEVTYSVPTKGGAAYNRYQNSMIPEDHKSPGDFDALLRAGVVRNDGLGDVDAPRTSSISKELNEVPSVRRAHVGIDFSAVPGEEVLAPSSGVVKRVTKMKNGLSMIDIIGPAGDSTRTLYVTSSVKEGETVVAGKTKLGTAENIVPVYGKNTPNHVHVIYHDPQCRPINPFTNESVQRPNNEARCH